MSRAMKFGSSTFQMESKTFPSGAAIRWIMVMKVAVFRYPRALALAAWKRPLRPSMRALLWVDVQR